MNCPVLWSVELSLCRPLHMQGISISWFGIPGKCTQCVLNSSVSAADHSTAENWPEPWALRSSTAAQPPARCYPCCSSLPDPALVQPPSCVHSQLSWGGCVQKDTVKHSSKTLLKRNSSLRDHSALFSELLQLQLCQTCPGLSMKYVTSSAKNTNAEKYFKCLYNSWCITCFLLEGKIIILAQITKKNGMLSIPKYVTMLPSHFKESCPSWEPLQQCMCWEALCSHTHSCT